MKRARPILRVACLLVLSVSTPGCGLLNILVLSQKGGGGRSSGDWRAPPSPAPYGPSTASAPAPYMMPVASGSAPIVILPPITVQPTYSQPSGAILPPYSATPSLYTPASEPVRILK